MGLGKGYPRFRPSLQRVYFFLSQLGVTVFNVAGSPVNIKTRLVAMSQFVCDLVVGEEVFEVDKLPLLDFFEKCLLDGWRQKRGRGCRGVTLPSLG